MFNLETAPPVALSLWNHDTNSKINFLGRALIDLNNLPYKCDDEDTGNEVPKPQWHSFRMGDDRSDVRVAEVLCSFTIVDLDFEFNQAAAMVDLSSVAVE